jgi:hypothetical protein
MLVVVVAFGIQAKLKVSKASRNTRADAPLEASVVCFSDVHVSTFIVNSRSEALILFCEQDDQTTSGVEKISFQCNGFPLRLQNQSASN